MIISKVGTFFNELLISWKESLGLLINKRFWLVTLKAVKETYSELFKRFWWLILLSTACDFLNGAHGRPIFNNLLYWSGFFLWLLLVYLIFLCVRSSIDKKNYAYYGSYSRSFVWFLLLLGSYWGYGFLVSYDWLSSIKVGSLFFVLGAFRDLAKIFSPFLAIYTFFYLDSPKRLLYFFKRFWSAFLLVFYTYPFCFVVWLLSILVSYCVLFVTNVLTHASIGFYASNVLAFFFVKLMFPLFVCLIYSLYTKQVHDHYDRYSA